MNQKIKRKLDLFFGQYKPLYHKKGEIIIRPEDVPSGVYFLKRGYVRDYSISETGEELTLIIFKPGDIFPLPWAINNEPVVRFLEAFTPIEVWRAPRKQFLRFLEKEPDVFFYLTARILTRLSGLMERMKYLVFGNAYTKVISILLICGERFGRVKKGFVEIQLPLTHKDIALLVGINRETASRQLERLMKKNLIEYYSKLVVLKNLDKLKKEARTQRE